MRAKGEWHSKLDDEQRISLEVNKTKRLLFDVSEAGPGKTHSAHVIRTKANIVM